MNKDIIQKLKALKPILSKEYGIEEFAVFGSYARDDYTKDSDIDIVIFKMKMKSGFDILYAKSFLEKSLNKKVDIGTYKSMKSFIRRKIEKDLIYV